MLLQCSGAADGSMGLTTQGRGCGVADYRSMRGISGLATFALLTATAICAGCNADRNPAAPGGIVTAGSLAPASPAVAADRPAGDGKLLICHRNQGTAGFVAISVATIALEAHLAHGDGRPGDPVPNQPGWTFGSDCDVSHAASVTIGFSGLVGNASAFSTYTESGFTVSVTGPSSFTRDWEVATLFGNPAPFIQFRVAPGAPATSGAIRVSAGGAMFRLASVDLYSSLTPIGYELRGFVNFTPVSTAAGTVPNTFGRFQTVSNPYGDVLVDSVIVVLINPAMPACCGNAIGLDNLVLLP